MEKKLYTKHIEDLHRSGLADDTIRALVFYSGTGEQTRLILGFDGGPGLVIPYPCINGSEPFYRVKPDNPPVIWETGNVSQIGSLLALREAELLLAKAQLTGNIYNDWYVRNQTRDFEIIIADLKRWLNEDMLKDKGNEG